MALILGDRALDAGLAALDTEATHIYVCSSQPTTYAEATSVSPGFALGNKSFGAGSVFGAPFNNSPDFGGRLITSVAVSGGTITRDGIVLWWAVVDSVNSRLLATGPLTVSGSPAGGNVVAGQTFSLDAFTIRLPSSPSGSAAYNNFIARTSGLNATHTSAYQTLLDGLTTDGLFNSDGTSSYLDALYIFCTQNSATALLNLVANSFNGTASGSPTFTADQGFTGTDASSTIYIDTGFNPTTASSPKFTLNLCHMGVWLNSLTVSGASGGATIGSYNGSSTLTQLAPRFNDGTSACYLSAAFNPATFVDDGTPPGYYVGNRTSNVLQAIYKNATQQSTNSTSTVSLPNGNFYILARNNVTIGAEAGDGRQISAAHFGSDLNGAQITALNNRIGAFRTAVGL